MNFKSLAITLAFSIVAVGFQANDAWALPEFKKVFEKAYSANHKDKDFQKAVKKASCNVCHVKAKGAKKDVQNEYGVALAKLIEGNAKTRKKAAKDEGGTKGEKAEKEKILAELNAAFKKVDAMKPKGGSKTYGELMKEGQLPIDPAKATEAYLAKKAKEDVAK